MDMSFWSGVSLPNFLFKHVYITSPQELVAVCFVTAALAFTFEASRTIRDYLYMEFLKKRSCPSSSTSNSKDMPMVLHEVKQGHNSNGQQYNHNGEESSSRPVPHPTPSAPVIATGTLSGSGKSCSKPSFQVGLVELSSSTLLHMVQMLLGYVLMLVVMTFNVWIFVSVLAGTTVGFFVFDGFNKKIHSVNLNRTSGTSLK